jgi:predicted TPR repeat methyltransferase
MLPVTTSRSSGDVIADRRYAYAQGAFEEQDYSAAADLARQTLDLVPGFAVAHALLGRALAALDRNDEAVASLNRALELEPDDPLGVRIDLAGLGAVEPGTAMTDGYVRALFDDYAPQFERHLVRSLRYRGPELIAGALRSAAIARLRSSRFRHVLDLGCGTGLMARALEGAYDTIDGVDLSPRMLAQAARTRLYRTLEAGELVAFLEKQPAGAADLVIAADVFVYMASLERAFAQAHRVLARGGFFTFTTQAGDADEFVLGHDSRYAHSEAYLRALAAETGFSVLSLERASIRQDRGEDVPGFLAVLER